MAITKVTTPDLIDLPTTISSVETNTDGVVLAKGSTSGTASVDYLVVAGGGGGAGNSSGGGGGGAGGLLTATADFAISTALDISVGVGGAGTTNETSGAVGVNGGDSIFSTITATGGGGAKNTGSGGSSSDGGSGGGASGGTSVGAGSANPTGQGNNGGIGSNPSDIGGGGGGAGGVGQPGGNRSGSTDGQGGAAISNSITGTSLLYAGGGGGGVCDFTYNSTPATAGLGGAGVFGTGGNGGQSGDQGTDPYTADGGVGVTNTGGGGGGGSRSAGGTNANGGAGGSGVVILRTASTTTATFVNATTSLTQVGGGAWTSGDKVYTITETTGTATVTFSSTVSSDARPVTGGSYILEDGEFRYNTTDKKVEYYDGANWFALTSTTAVPQAGTTGVCNYPTTAVALYQFESNGNDTCGNWNSTSEPGITYFTPGKFGYAANFTQTTSGVYLPKITTLTNDISVSGWLKLGSTTTTNGLRFIEINATTVGYAGVLAVFYAPSNGEWKVRVGDGSSSETDVLIHIYTLTQAVWYNVCVTRDDSSNVTKLYINGSEVDSETISATPTVQASAISVIGQYVGSSTGYGWLGDMDQIRLFSSVLTSDQVTALYQETAP